MDSLYVGASGLFKPSTGKTYTRVIEEDDDIIGTVDHEEGHRLDWDKNNFRHYSEHSKKWKDALRLEQESGWQGEKTLSRTDDSAKLISEHLNNGHYKPKKFPAEALAEINRLNNYAYLH